MVTLRRFGGLHLWASFHEGETCCDPMHHFPFDSRGGTDLPPGTIWVSMPIHQLDLDRETIELLKVDQHLHKSSHCSLIGTARGSRPELPSCFRVSRVLIPQQIPKAIVTFYFDRPIVFTCSGLQRSVSANGVCPIWNVFIFENYPFYNLDGNHKPEAATLSGIYFPDLDE